MHEIGLNESERRQANLQLLAMMAPEDTPQEVIAKIQEQYDEAQAAGFCLGGKPQPLGHVRGLETRLHQRLDTAAAAPELKGAMEATAPAPINPTTGHNFPPEKIREMQDWARAYQKKHKRASVREVTRAVKKHFKIQILPE